jgi:N utilization substance protein A
VSIYQSIEILSKEKGIDSKILLDAVKDAMLVAARKHFKKTTEEMDAEFDPKSGGLQIYTVRRVVEAVEDPLNQVTLDAARQENPAAEIGTELRQYLPTDDLGRIAAQTAKQVILQKVREAERETVFKQFAGRDGEMVQCTVKRIEGMDLVVEIDREKIEARLPKREQSRLDNFQINDRVKCVIRGVEKGGKNSGVLVSRAAPELVMRLFEQEVPEIYDNTVVIKACAREAGERTKIAVWSRDRDVDSVGACVGMKGMRVQSIIRELRNEKIDIIEYSDDPVSFATHALSPAKITRVAIVDAASKHMEVIVDDSQLSLAIGKKGQNVRLAAKLLGWRIDIKSEEEKRQEVETQMAQMQAAGAPVSVLVDYGMPDELAGALVAGGIATVEKLGAMTPEQLQELPDVGPEMLERIVASINAYYSHFEGGPGVEEAVIPDEAGLAALPEVLQEVAADPAAESLDEPVSVESATIEDVVTIEEQGEKT